MNQLTRRAEGVVSRAAVRAWEYRQRNHAKGVWVRLQRLLADTDRLYVISDETMRRLTEAGFDAEPIGLELEPPIRMVVIPGQYGAWLEGAPQIRVALHSDLLRARNIALVPFEDSVLGVCLLYTSDAA